MTYKIPELTKCKIKKIKSFTKYAATSGQSSYVNDDTGTRRFFDVTTAEEADAAFGAGSIASQVATAVIYHTPSVYFVKNTVTAGSVVTADNLIMVKPIPSACKCGYPNEYSLEANQSDGSWKCTSCKLWGI